MTKCLFNALLFTVMEIVFPALLHQKSGSVTLTLFWARLCRCISHYDSQIKTFCWHSSRALPRAGSPNGSPAQRDGDGPSRLCNLLVPRCPGLGQPGRGNPGTEMLWNQGTELQRGSALLLHNSPHSYSLLTLPPSHGKQGVKCLWIFSEVWNTGTGGSGLEGWRQILLHPKEGVQKFLLNKWFFSGGSGWGRKKHIKRVMKRKQSILFSLHFAFPSLHSHPPKQSLFCSWPSKLE